jgi:hypothetical protein
VKAPKAPKAPKVPEGPNPYGIHLNSGVVVTMTYLRKWAQCATRGMKFNRAANINHFMSPEFLQGCVGISTGQYSALCHNSDLWNDPAHPELTETAKTPRGAGPKKDKKSKGKTVVDPAAVAAGEAAILDTGVSAPETVAPAA